MTAFNARLELFRTDDEKPIGIVHFNFDTDQELKEFKDRVVLAHLAIVNKPVHQVLVSIMNNTDFKDRNAAVGITGDEMGDL